MLSFMAVNYIDLKDIDREENKKEDKRVEEWWLCLSEEHDEKDTEVIPAAGSRFVKNSLHNNQ